MKEQTKGKEQEKEQDKEEEKQPEKKEEALVDLPKGVARLKITGGSVSFNGEEYKADAKGHVVVPEAAAKELVQHGCTRV